MTRHRQTHAQGASPRLAMLQRWCSIAFEWAGDRHIDSLMVNTAEAAICIHIRLISHVRTNWS